MSKFTRFLRNTALTLGIVVGVSGCKNWEGDLEQRLVQKGFTKEQAEVGAAVGLRRVFTEKVEKDDGTVTYQFNYDGIKDSEVLQVVREMHADIKKTLDFDGNLNWAKYLENTGRGKHLQKQEKIYKYLQDVLKEKVLHRKFEKLIGQSFNYGGYGYSSYRSAPEDKFKVDSDEKFSLATIFPLNRKPMEFIPDYVTQAMKRGDLKDKKFKVEEVMTVYEFLEKVSNPQALVDYGEKRWVFKQRAAGLKITAYNLDNDKEKKPDYIEVFRLNKDGTPESKPAVRIFKTAWSSSLEVIVADRDFEGEGGYGQPDYVGRTFPVTTGRDLLGHTKLINFIFQKEREQEKREVPEMKELNKLYIVEAGTMSMVPFDCNGECWENFIPEYKTGPGGRHNPFTVHIRKSIDSMKDIPPGEKEHKDSSLNWIALEYEGSSRVVEFYKPKEEFKDKKFRIEVIGRRVSLIGEDGVMKNYPIRTVIEDKPYRIDFDRNPHRRWEIKDKDDNSDCYECKREVARPGDNELIPKK
ncbi:hypothetical protein GOV03_01545 [Candidatus Woesearchaeota archaeon]|nr:hypothetical protein [Candidatus Woesearchaeota archaeon]